MTAPAHDPATGEILEAPPPKPPPRQRPPETPDEFEQAVEAAQAKLAEAGGSKGFRSDPYSLVLAALHCVLGVLSRLVRRVEKAVFTDAERAAIRADVTASSKAGIIAGAGEAVAMLTAQARAKDRRTVAFAAVGALAVVAGTGVGCFYAGRQSAQTEVAALIRAEHAELKMAQERITLPIADARLWALLILANPAPREAVAKARDRRTDASGRSSGLVPLWLEPPRLPTTN